MAPASRPVVYKYPGRPVRRRNSLGQILVAGVVGVMGYAGLAGAALGPASGPLGAMGLTDAGFASLHYSGDAPVLVGSAHHLFETAGFVGPNRSEKTDRYKPEIDVIAHVEMFSEARQQLAAIRAPADDPITLAQSRPEADAPAEADEGPRMSVAALGGVAGSSALAAIDAVASAASSSAPMPVIASEQLAYARANAPINEGYVNGEAMQANARELQCLSTAIYFEARGESYRGQVAVAQVVLNRVKDHRYPDTICAVVYQNQHQRNACQFSFACDGIPETVTDRRAWAQAQEIAAKVTSGELYLPEVADSTHYHATYVRPAWAPRMQRMTQIGLHIFYKFKPGWLFG